MATLVIIEKTNNAGEPVKHGATLVIDSEKLIGVATKSLYVRKGFKNGTLFLSQRGNESNISTISRISVTSEKNIGLQIIKDRITPTEKKILINMLNSGLNEGQVRNKIFHISKTGNNTAEVVIGTIAKSIILGRNEIVKQRVKIKYS